MHAPSLSVIIPARNEGRWLGRTLDCVERYVPFQHEIIVVDNGSSDETAAIARDAGALVLSSSAASVAALRNAGAEIARGAVLLFIDADVTLTDQWRQTVPRAVAEMLEGPPALFGSHHDVPPDPNWLDRTWQAPRTRRLHGYLPAGHILVRADHFRELGGFDASMETGEDWDLSERAKAAGFRIVEDPRLRAIHWGYPRTLRAFMIREAWHGRGDFVSLHRILHSRVAVLTLFFALANLTTAIALVSGYLLFASLAAGAVILLCFAAALRQYHHAGLAPVLCNTPLYYVYFTGRTIAMLSVAFRRPSTLATATDSRRGTAPS